MADCDPREDPDIAVVIDTGSCLTRVGFAGDDAPRAIFPSIVGRPKVQPGIVGSHLKDTYVGDEAVVENSILKKTTRPVEGGIITNWDDIEKIWLHSFYNELRIDPTQRSVFLTEAVTNPIVSREKTTQTIFEKIKVPRAYLCSHAYLCQYVYGYTTATVVSVGQDVARVVPMQGGQIIGKAISHMFKAGTDLDYHLLKLLNDKGHSFATSCDVEILREIKEKLCYVALDFEEEKKKMTDSINKTYTLPDGKDLTISEEQFSCPEILFGETDQETTLHELVLKSISRCEEDIRNMLFEHILLEGGSTLFPGFPERLQKEVQAFAPAGITVQVEAIPDRRHCAWLGGSVLASTGMFQQYWITKDEYEECGPSIVQRKCYQAP
uniref:actin-100-like isoform X2 n=1 Tax=Styela clava TaxID=7725 RepID=UPI00193A82CB|nr:actin-100-like isoform X2 [Styela clava]